MRMLIQTAILTVDQLNKVSAEKNYLQLLRTLVTSDLCFTYSRILSLSATDCWQTREMRVPTFSLKSRLSLYSTSKLFRDMLIPSGLVILLAHNYFLGEHNLPP
jgi:hypothetical protein